MVVAPLQRVTAAAVNIHAGAAGDEEAETIPVFIELTLDPSFPALPFVQFVEDHKGGSGRPLGVPDRPAVLSVVPIQVETRAPTVEDHLGKGCLADLAGSCYEDHFPLEVSVDRPFEIAVDSHGQIMPQCK